MENQKDKVLTSYSELCDNYRFIPFVSASEGLGENAGASTSASRSNFLSGEEASLFYSEIISSPSSVSVSKPSCSTQPTEKLKKYSISSKNCNSRLTIFHHAQEGNIEGIEYFLSEGCNIDIEDMYGWTPLMCATFEGHCAAVECLIRKGANLNIKNKQGQTALVIAVERNHNSLVKLLSGGIIEQFASTEHEIEAETKYCNICDCCYTEPVTTHESSIPHLLSCKRNNVSTFYHIPENNKGFQIMLKKGWDKNKGLGRNAKGRKFPIKTILKNDRSCIGGKKEVSKVTHFGPNDTNSVKKHNQPSVKLFREKTLKKWQIQKLERKNRQKEINFRRQFNMEM